MHVDHIQETMCSLNLCAFFKNRKRLSGNRSGGLCVVFEKNLTNYISHVNSSCKLVQWIRINRELLGTDKDIMLGNTYIPPEGSTYCSLTPYQDLQQELLKFSDCYFCIAGDLNSRTKNLRDYVLPSDFEQDQLDFDTEVNISLKSTKMLKDLNIRLERQSTDTVNANTYGTSLIDFCRTNNMFICNGRIGPNFDGNATHDKGSVIDYVVACPEILARVGHFYVQQETIFSDSHFIISWSIQCPDQGNRDIIESNNRIKIKKTHRNMWSNSKAPEFSDHLDIDTLNSIRGGLNNPETPIDHIINKMQTLFEQAANSTLGPECEYEIDNRI